MTWLRRVTEPAVVSVALVAAFLTIGGAMKSPVLIAGTDFTISSTITSSPACSAPAILAPGITRCFTYSVHNPKAVAITVTSLSLSVDSSRIPPTCPVSNLDLTHTGFTGSLAVPAGGDATTSGLTIALKETGLNQDGCKSTGANNVTFYFVYSGSATYVQVFNTTTALASSLNPSDVGQSVTFTATVTPTGTPPGPVTGSVQFRDGSTPLGSVPVASGQAAVTTSALSAGTHSISAVFTNNDGNFSGSTSPVVSQVVNGTGHTTSSSLVSSKNPSTFGQSVKFTDTVTSSSGKPAGTVTFYDGASSIGTGTLNSGGKVTLTTSGLTAGTHSIKAVYAGKPGFTASTSNTISEVVNARKSATKLSTSVNPSVYGQADSFTAMLRRSTPLMANPTGTINFFDGARYLGSATVNPSGQATLSTSTLTVGTHRVTATYSGDTNFTPAKSNTVVQTVGP